MLEEGAGLRPVGWRNGAGCGVGLGEGIEIDAEPAGAIGFCQDMKSRAPESRERGQMVVLVPTGQIVKGFFAERLR